VVYGSLTNRVVINKAVTVQSVNGAGATTILGYSTIGDCAVRCVYLTNKVVLNGFTLAFGATRSAGDTNSEQSGGGAWCESTNAYFYNCLFATNTAYLYGSGECFGTASNCTFVGNAAYRQSLANYGGAANGGALVNSTFLGNRSQNGGGISFCTASNCTLIYNIIQLLNTAAGHLAVR
jgi:hypothetical protein